MDELIDELIEEKMVVVLKLIRTNSTADEVLKITQSFVNLTHGDNNRLAQQGTKTARTKGPGT